MAHNKHEKHFTTDSKTSCDLLKMPLEIRQHIYETLLCIPRRDHLSLLCACKCGDPQDGTGISPRFHSDSHAGKQIWNEGRHIFETRPVHFKSQKELVAFVTSRNESVRRRVTTVKICLQDLDVETMRPYLEDEVMGSRRARNTHPYTVELNCIRAALDKLTAVQSIALLHPYHTESNLPPRFIVAGVLQHICRRFPQLKHIRIDYDGHSLEPLASLSNLRSLCLSGFSSTPPESAETAIFNHLRKVNNLRLISNSYANGRPFFKSADPEQSFNANVLASLAPLRVLSLFEPPTSTTTPTPASQSSITTTTTLPTQQPESQYFLSPSFLKAAITHHAPTLQSLSLTSLTTPAPPIPTIIAALLLSTTALHALSLTLPNLEPTLLDALPATIEDLRLLVTDAPHAQTMLARLDGHRYRLRRLRVVCFVVINDVRHVWDEGDGVGVGVALPCMGIGRSPTGAGSGAEGSRSPGGVARRWTVRWGIWQPFGED
jgi:hypothetical protein